MEKEKREQKILVYHRPNHLANLQNFQTENKLCDVKIQASGECYPAHKIILAAAIPFFEKMFINNFKESSEDKVELYDMKTSIKYFIDFAYSGHIIVDEDNVENIMIDADYLGLKDLTDECEKFLETFICIKNVGKLRRLTSLVSCERLQEKTDRYLLQNFMRFQKTEDYLSMSFEYLKHIISNDDLQIPSEEYIFEAVLRWTKSNIDERNKYLPELLASMRLSHLTAEYLINNVLKNELIACSEKCRDLINNVIYSRIISKERSLFDDDQTQKNKCEIGKERILIISQANSSLMEIYNPITDTWERFSSNQKSRLFVSCAVLNGKLYSVGGEVSSLPSVEVYEPHNNRWKVIALMNCKRSFPKLVALDNYLYICGGYDGENYVNTVERYCPDSDEWETVAPMNINRQSFGAAAFKGHIYVCGGYNGNEYLTSMERYDPITDKWSLVDVFIKKDRRHFELAALNGKLYVCGGRSPGSAALNTVEMYDPELNTCECVESMNSPRRCLMVLAYMGKLWAIGGHDGMDDLATVEVYDPDLDIWTYGAPLSAPQPWACGGVISIY